MPSDECRVGRLTGPAAGFASGLTKVVVGHGFDTCRSRHGYSSTPSSKIVLLFLCFSKPFNGRGFFALYKGATPPALGWAAIDSVLLGSLHNYRLFLLHNGIMTEDPTGTGERLTLLAHGTAGLFAGLTSAPLATPIELLKVRLQLQIQKSVSDRQFRGPIDCAQHLMRSQGVLGLWTGFSGGLLFRANFFYMFLAFEACMRGLSRLNGTFYEPSVGVANLIAGGTASLCFWTMAIPFDRMKNQMMSHPYPLPYPETRSITRPSLISVACQIYSNQGLRGFYRGLAPCFIRAFPSNACAFFVYEGLLRALGAEQTRH
ncbi:Mitochondrial substrate carrier family protein L [Mycena venus]|uniref:Mitochondrial substrate carrier family protein L n=1 Tax=Mycena venus TaxID=2733690 RepID=A0A8H6XVF6_9AGAR|nr:Mitochondrial substrate carrier family protein L [Mycena venus]